MKFKLFIGIAVIVSMVNATRIWSESAIRHFENPSHPFVYPQPETLSFGPRRFNYLQRIKLVCDFVARYQVSDSLSPDYGGIIEAEHLPAIIETDNTQEALWVWTRWYQLTGRDDYRENIRRAWIYVLRHPAYQEHGSNPANIWYAVWNCGLGLWMEWLYRQIYHDSSFDFYADSCRLFYLTNPLNPVNYLDIFVTAQASGMAYEFARHRNDRELLDTALSRGIRVKNWIEAAPRSRLHYQSWAMCGATAFWGVCQTFCQSDTLAGKTWVNTYAESLPGFYPAGTWNCSHNSWLAYAFNAAAEILHSPLYRAIHQYLTDTLLMLDTDFDGGIPATWTDPPAQDQTWISTYLDFMGMDRLVTPVFEHDLALFEFIAPRRDTIYLPGDSVKLAVPVANIGKTASLPETVRLFVSGQIIDSLALDTLAFLAVDTLWFPALAAETSGLIRITAALSGDERPDNDTSEYLLKVHSRCLVNGRLLDSTTRQPVSARIITYLLNCAMVWDSCNTDSTGSFSLNLIDSLFTLVIEPTIPYYRHYCIISVHQDTNILLLTSPAQVLLVNTDTSDTFQIYYTATLDSLNIHWCYWSRFSNGPIPYYLTNQLQAKTIIWFSGNAVQQTVPEIDRDSLNLFLENGGKLFLTGQNIAQELAGSQFLEEVIGCRFDSSGWRGFLVAGVRNDSLGRHITGTATAGGNGANNQNSRDIISPLLNARKFLVYDSTTGIGAGIRRDYPSGGRIVLLGFGFEAVNRPASRPEYYSRVRLMNLILNWLFTGIGIDEEPAVAQRKTPWQVTPRIFTTSLSISAPQEVNLQLFDLSGRKIASIHAAAGTTTWPLPRLPAGIYFIKEMNERGTTVVKIRKNSL
ncbi:MAG: T9SS type A sorting domain-containing protein [candidate division WOR-3 bacterium]